MSIRQGCVCEVVRENLKKTNFGDKGYETSSRTLSGLTKIPKKDVVRCFVLERVYTQIPEIDMSCVT